MNQALGTFLFIAAIAFIVVSNAMFTVDEKQQAIVLQLGQPVGTAGENLIKGPGLHFKIPLIQDVRYFDSRVLSVDPDPARVNISSEDSSLLAEVNAEEISNTSAAGTDVSGEPILVDTFARYRITDPLAFLKTLRTVPNANQRIETVMNDATRNALGKTTLNEILSEERTAIMARIREAVNQRMQEGGFGIEIVDIRIVRADLTDKLRTSTVNRMITERRERATETRARGREKALEIRSTAEKEKTVLLANAQRDSQIMRGEGDREAIRTYANAFNKDPDFYSFLRSMEAYGETLSNEDTQMILSPNSEFLRFIRER